MRDCDVGMDVRPVDHSRRVSTDPAAKPGIVGTIERQGETAWPVIHVPGIPEAAVLVASDARDPPVRIVVVARDDRAPAASVTSRMLPR